MPMEVPGCGRLMGPVSIFPAETFADRSELTNTSDGAVLPDGDAEAGLGGERSFGRHGAEHGRVKAGGSARAHAGPKRGGVSGETAARLKLERLSSFDGSGIATQVDGNNEKPKAYAISQRAGRRSFLG